MTGTNFKAALVGCLAMVVSGCDTIYGVTREAGLEADIQLDCVRRVVASTPGITNLDYDASHDGKGLFHPTPWVYNFSFAGTPESNIIGILQIYKEYDGKLSYHDALVMINRKPLQRWIDATRPVMREIEDQLASRCGATGLPDDVKETCQGVVCRPL